MACAKCGKSVLFAKKKSGDRKYCSEYCYDTDKVGRISQTVPGVDAYTLAKELKHSPCPCCKETKDLDIYYSYFIWSIIIITSWKTLSIFSCRSCARKDQASNLLISCFTGWWGIPFGILLTPIFIVANIVQLSKNKITSEPSADLIQQARMQIAKEIRDEEFRKLDEQEALERANA